MPDYERIYHTQAERYDRLVMREDYKKRLWPALCNIRCFEGLEVVELGAGTGRLTALLLPVVRKVWAFDISTHMLTVAWAKLSEAGRENWQLAVADTRRLPVSDRVADVSISGWSVGTLNAKRFPSSWHDEIGRALGEMRRVLRPGGIMILVETLGTGEETPRAPHEGLEAYYRLLEDKLGFSVTWIRTDYRFASLREAEELIRFFFGDPLAVRVAAERLVILPECTGLWWLQV